VSGEHGLANQDDEEHLDNEDPTIHDNYVQHVPPNPNLP